MPKKKENTGLIEDVTQYCHELIERIKDDEKIMAYESIRLKVNYLKELTEDTDEQLQISKDEEAKIGHKTTDSSFFGYKTHLAMTSERIITGATVTSGEKHDGKELQKLIEKSKENGIEIEAVIGDGAYAEKENIIYAKEKGIKLVAKISKTVSYGNARKMEGFEYNKDAGRYICPNGTMSIRVAKNGVKKAKEEGAVLRETHYFDIEKCKHCRLREQCGFKENQKTKTYTVTLRKDEVHQTHLDLQKTEEYQALAKNRYMIEAKNAELKSRHGYSQCSYSGVLGMRLQAAMAIYATNMKRIVKLIDQK